MSAPDTSKDNWFEEYCQNLFKRVEQIHSDNVLNEMFIKYEN
jgi:hypothetical protein